MHHIDQMITIMDVILRDSNKNALIHLINAKHTLYMIDDIFVEHSVKIVASHHQNAHSLK